MTSQRSLIQLAATLAISAVSAGCGSDRIYTKAGCSALSVRGISKSQVYQSLALAAGELGYIPTKGGISVDSGLVLNATEPYRSIIAGENLRSDDYFVTVHVEDPEDAVRYSLDAQKIILGTIDKLGQPPENVRAHDCSATLPPQPN